MFRLPSRILILCLVLSSIAVQAFAQDAVKLEYKYIPNELLRYKLILNANLSIHMDAPNANMGQMPNIPVQAVGVIKQRTKRVLPNGDAEIVVAVESLKVKIGNKSENAPTREMPVMTMIVSKNGMVKDVKGLEETGGQLSGIQLANPTTLGQYNGLPDFELMVGDTWTQDVPMPEGAGNVRAAGKLLSTNTKLGNYNVATFTQDVGGSINLGMPIPIPIGDQSANNAAMDTKGTFLGNAKIYFSTEKGQLVRTEGKAFAQMVMSLSGGQNSQQGGISIDVDMDYEMFLLPNSK